MGGVELPGSVIDPWRCSRVFFAGAAAVGVLGATCPAMAARLSCGVSTEAPVPRPVAVLPASIVARFAALSRPSTPSDRLPAFASPRNVLGGELALYASGLIRRLVSVPGGGVYLVPGLSSNVRVPAASCYRRLTRAARIRLRSIVAFHLARADKPTYCIVRATRKNTVRSHTTSASATCRSFAEDPVFAIGPYVLGDRQLPTLAGFVPTGVAAVRISYRHFAPALASVPASGLFFAPAPQLDLVGSSRRRSARSCCAPEAANGGSLVRTALNASGSRDSTASFFSMSSPRRSTG